LNKIINIAKKMGTENELIFEIDHFFNALREPKQFGKMR